jgi:hypothetical protein
MNVFALMREDQSELGFVDVCVIGIFARREDAEACRRSEAASARVKGLLIEEDPDTPDGAWQVAWEIQEHSLR